MIANLECQTTSMIQNGNLAAILEYPVSAGCLEIEFLAGGRESNHSGASRLAGANAGRDIFHHHAIGGGVSQHGRSLEIGLGMRLAVVTSLDVRRLFGIDRPAARSRTSASDRVDDVTIVQRL